MDIYRESYLNEYRRQEQLAGLETKRHINEALAAKGNGRHRITPIGQFLHALGNARKIRIEIHFDYHEPQPNTSSC